VPRAVIGQAAGRQGNRDDARVMGFADLLAVGVAGFPPQHADTFFSVVDHQGLIAAGRGLAASAIAISGRAASPRLSRVSHSQF
jgi:hypothetical protein